jgi:hypothetical protein
MITIFYPHRGKEALEDGGDCWHPPAFTTNDNTTNRTDCIDCSLYSTKGPLDFEKFIREQRHPAILRGMAQIVNLQLARRAMELFRHVLAHFFFTALARL